MPEKSQKQMTYETHQAMFGVEGTEDKGLVDDVKTMVKLVATQNSRVRKNTIIIYTIVGILAASGLGAGLFQVFVG